MRVTGWCGDEPVSDDVRRGLRADGVEDRLVAVGRAVRAIVLVEPDGERTIVSTGGEAVLLPGAVDVDAVLAEAGWLHVDGYALDEVGGDELLRVAWRAREAGVPVSFEPPSVASLPSRAAWIARLPALALLLGRPDEVRAVDGLLGQAPGCTVIHDAGNPVRVRDGQVETQVPVRTVPPTTLGAGDRFAGGLLAARLRGQAWVDAVGDAVTAAHLS